LTVEQKLVEYAKAAHGHHRGGEYFHAPTMRLKN